MPTYSRRALLGAVATTAATLPLLAVTPAGSAQRARRAAPAVPAADDPLLAYLTRENARLTARMAKRPRASAHLHAHAMNLRLLQVWTTQHRDELRSQITALVAREGREAVITRALSGTGMSHAQMEAVTWQGLDTQLTAVLTTPDAFTQTLGAAEKATDATGEQEDAKEATVARLVRVQNGSTPGGQIGAGCEELHRQCQILQNVAQLTCAAAALTLNPALGAACAVLGGLAGTSCLLEYAFC